MAVLLLPTIFILILIMVIILMLILMLIMLILIMMTQDCEATDLRALQQGEKVKPHKVHNFHPHHTLNFFSFSSSNL